jgi:hypothetical protein
VSFRNRLGLFFVLIVIVPQVAITGVLFALVARGEKSVRNADIAAAAVGSHAVPGQGARR